MPLTKEEFQNACAHLTSTGDLIGQGELFIDVDNQVVLDEGNNNADITPDETTLTQAIQAFDDAQTIKESSEALRQLSRSEALVYYRQAKIAANGNLAALSEIYTRARDYEQQNEDLAALIATNRALYEFIAGRTLNLSSNQDKAIYLFNLFEPALILAAIEEA